MVGEFQRLVTRVCCGLSNGERISCCSHYRSSSLPDAIHARIVIAQISVH